MLKAATPIRLVFSDNHHRLTCILSSYRRHVKSVPSGSWQLLDLRPCEILLLFRGELLIFLRVFLTDLMAILSALLIASVVIVVIGVPIDAAVLESETLIILVEELPLDLFEVGIRQKLLFEVRWNIGSFLLCEE